ncbi:MAG: DUF3568 family protein [Lentisphaeria bacterium]|nr:DUF3568 domain-containing protein [Lentisphaeria bacterium]NQZ67900.1 DUF3568 family protein [Lentisphaeria bacterium]
MMKFLCLFMMGFLLTGCLGILTIGSEAAKGTAKHVSEMPERNKARLKAAKKKINRAIAIDHDIKKNYNFSLSAVKLSSEDTLREMNYKHIIGYTGHAIGHVIATTKDEKEIFIALKSINVNWTEMSIRVGTKGNNEVSEKIVAAIDMKIKKNYSKD